MEIRDAAHNRLKDVEKDIDDEKKVSPLGDLRSMSYFILLFIRQELAKSGEEIGQEEEDLWYLRRLDGGLFTLQTVDYILAWIAMEDDGVRTIALNNDPLKTNLPLTDPRSSSTDAHPQGQVIEGYRENVADLPRQCRRR